MSHNVVRTANKQGNNEVRRQGRVHFLEDLFVPEKTDPLVIWRNGRPRKQQGRVLSSKKKEGGLMTPLKRGKKQEEPMGKGEKLQGGVALRGHKFSRIYAAKKKTKEG